MALMAKPCFEKYNLPYIVVHRKIIKVLSSFSGCIRIWQQTKRRIRQHSFEIMSARHEKLCNSFHKQRGAIRKMKNRSSLTTLLGFCVFFLFIVFVCSLDG